MSRRIFGYLKKYPKRGHAINPQPLNVDVNYEKVKMKYYFGNKYAPFSEDIDKKFPKPLLDELESHVFVDANHGHNKFTGRSTTGLFSLVVSTPTTW